MRMCVCSVVYSDKYFNPNLHQHALLHSIHAQTGRCRHAVLAGILAYSQRSLGNPGLLV